MENRGRLRQALGINPSLYKKLAIDPIKDLAPVGLLAATQSVIAAADSLTVLRARRAVCPASVSMPWRFDA
ncbi:hypothetical protein [Ramlibacter sp.]|uniref:hypothetical protein n=1 Tax=Ramlibacter sp. TaxID=1917967 RepID=UPI003D0E8247